MAEDKDRRQFMKAVAAGGTAALASWPALTTVASAAPRPSTYGALTAAQAALIGAISEQFIPTDDFPGALKAGVVHYIDGILAGPFGNFYRARYEKGLLAVDRLSQEHYRLNFVALDADEKDAVLKLLESPEEMRRHSHEFLGTILQHTFEGYYGDGEHGGDLEGASWKMIGFAG